jgi:hypothetical protein
MEYYYDYTNEIWKIYKENPSTRRKSWITDEQILTEYGTAFVEKIVDIQTSFVVNVKTKIFVTNVFNFLIDHGFLTWKQFDNVMLVTKTYDEYIKNKKGNYVLALNKNILTVKELLNNRTFSINTMGFDCLELDSTITDKKLDELYYKYFGELPMFEEEEVDGLQLSYDKSGSRIFLLPEV